MMNFRRLSVLANIASYGIIGFHADLADREPPLLSPDPDIASAIGTYGAFPELLVSPA